MNSICFRKTPAEMDALPDPHIFGITVEEEPPEMALEATLEDKHSDSGNLSEPAAVNFFSVKEDDSLKIQPER